MVPGEEDLLRALLCAGMFPAVASVRQSKRPSFKTREDGKVELHLTSVLGRESFFSHRWLVYSDKVCQTPRWGMPYTLLY